MPPFLPVFWIGPKPEVTPVTFLSTVRLMYVLSVPLFPEAIGFYMSIKDSNPTPVPDPTSTSSAAVRVYPIEGQEEMSALQDALANPTLLGMEILSIDLNEQN